MQDLELPNPEEKEQSRRYNPPQTSGNTPEQWSSKQRGLGSKTDLWISGTKERAQLANPHTHSPSSTKERIYNGEKTVSSASGVGKVGQPHGNQ